MCGAGARTCKTAGSSPSYSSGLGHLESARPWQMLPTTRSILGTVWRTWASPMAITPWGRAERVAWASLSKALLSLAGLAWHLARAGGLLALRVMSFCPEKTPDLSGSGLSEAITDRCFQLHPVCPAGLRPARPMSLAAKPSGLGCPRWTGPGSLVPGGQLCCVLLQWLFLPSPFLARSGGRPGAWTVAWPARCCSRPGWSQTRRAGTGRLAAAIPLAGSPERGGL